MADEHNTTYSAADILPDVKIDVARLIQFDEETGDRLPDIVAVRASRFVPEQGQKGIWIARTDAETYGDDLSVEHALSYIMPRSGDEMLRLILFGT